MKAFFTWLVIQCLFARMLFALMLNLWAAFKLPGDQVAYFIVPPMLVCVAETIVSGVLLYNIWSDTREYAR
jgi:hypothetical protein